MARMDDVVIRLTVSTEGLNAAFREAKAAFDELAVAFWRGLLWHKKLSHALGHPRAAWRFWRASIKAGNQQ